MKIYTMCKECVCGICHRDTKIFYPFESIEGASDLTLYKFKSASIWTQNDLKVFVILFPTSWEKPVFPILEI